MRNVTSTRDTELRICVLKNIREKHLTQREFGAQVSRRFFVCGISLGSILLAIGGCGSDDSESSPTPAETSNTDADQPSGPNLARALPALPEMKGGRGDQSQSFTENGRLDRVVYFSGVTAGHVLNYYLDEMPAIGWTEVSRSKLSAKGGEIEYESPDKTARLRIKVTREPRNRSNTVLALSTKLDGKN